ncbi:hypothetical protein CEXT_161851 [Caerostris extrusa]|uniref:Uncharacterized protein n=1 Tax=Caerostris extrusa TaxID=172846 RepID=A0AAV4VTC2_CAEEX|nr:hypothetical protein CEXT_161851 [Caerostris extrusa]
MITNEEEISRRLDYEIRGSMVRTFSRSLKMQNTPVKSTGIDRATFYRALLAGVDSAMGQIPPEVHHYRVTLFKELRDTIPKENGFHLTLKLNYSTFRMMIVDDISSPDVETVYHKPQPG